MKIARYSHNNRIQFGKVEDQMLRMLEGDIFGEYTETDTLTPISEVTILPPTVPTNVVCVGLNYLEHIQELGVPIPKEPIIFLKPPSCLIGNGESIVYPTFANRVDYEGELAVVIKKKMARISEDQALAYVLGYSCFNDITEREMAGRDPFLLTLAKSFDTFGAFGPYIVTDLDPNNMELKTYLNGQLMQQDNTKNCVFNVGRVLSFITRHITLYPGDVVITGTPKGIAPMKPGDVVEVTIEEIGKLTNPVVGAES